MHLTNLSETDCWLTCRRIKRLNRGAIALSAFLAGKTFNQIISSNLDATKVGDTIWHRPLSVPTSLVHRTASKPVVKSDSFAVRIQKSTLSNFKNFVLLQAQVGSNGIEIRGLPDWHFFHYVPMNFFVATSKFSIIPDGQECSSEQSVA